MPLRNRVTPRGELVAHAGRGLVYGNRGCLHDSEGRIVRPYAGRRWIACRLEFKGWRRGELLRPGRFTELFFLDEATAFAAGHRPCALCRREDYERFAAAWRGLHPADRGADAIDVTLHEERLDLASRLRRVHAASYTTLPDGVFVLVDDEPLLVLDDVLLRWTAGGYGPALPRPARGRATLLTPPSIVAVLRAGWASAVPFLHPSASRGQAATRASQAGATGARSGASLWSSSVRAKSSRT